MIGDANESVLQVDNYKVTALIDSGAQISTITESFVKLLKLQTRSLKRLLKIEGTGGGQVPYKGYVEVTLKVPEVAKFKEQVLFLIIADSEYGNRVPVQLGTLHIDMLLNSATAKELASLGKTWERGQVGRVIANKQAQIEGFDLNSVKGKVRLTRSLTVKPGEGCQITAVTNIKGNSKRLNVLVESLRDCEFDPGLEVIPVYSTCRAGSSKVWVMFFNHSERAISLPKGTHVGTVTAANFIPNKIAPRYTDDDEETQEKEQAYAGARHRKSG